MTIGFAANLRSWLLSHPVPYPKNKEQQHQVLTYKALLAPLGISPSNTPPKLYLDPAEITRAKEFLQRLEIDPARHTVIGINPGAAYGSAKCWLPERFVRVSQKLLEDPKVRILYFADGKGEELVSSICKNLPENVINLAAKTTIRELMALISLCRVLLTNDSGPMHIAAALGTPLLALFGSTSEIKTGPMPQGEVIHKHVECSPCYKRVCPIDFRCMTQIESDEVVQRLKKIIHETA
jgi:heptosyltransferase-2